MTEKSQRSMPSAKELDEGYLLSLAFLTPFALGAITYELYRKYIADKKVSAAEVVVSENSSDMDTFDRMPGATEIVENMVERRTANQVLFEKNAPTLWPAGGLTVVNMIDAIHQGNNLPAVPTAKI